MKVHNSEKIISGDMLHIQDPSKPFYVPAVHCIGQTVGDMKKYSDGELLAVVREP